MKTMQKVAQNIAVTREAVETFLFEEAALADAHRYSDWLALWAKDAFYFAPANDDDVDEEMHVALINEGYAGLEDRVRRLNSGLAHTQSPKSRLSRAISNVRFSMREDGLVEVHSVFNLTAFRRGTFETFAGRMVHHLRPDGTSFQIVRKAIYLVNNDGYLPNMSFLL